MSPLASLLSRGKDDAGLDEHDIADMPIARLQVVAKVNLLPDEIAEAERFRREQIIRVGAVAAAVVIVALASLAASSSVKSAQSKVNVEAARSVQLRAQVASLSAVPQTAAALATAQTQRTGALGQEVRWSEYLNNLGLLAPDTTQLQTLTITQVVDPTAAGAAPGAGLPISATGIPGIASVTFGGMSKTTDDVSYFLDAIAKQKGNVDPYFSQAQAMVDPVSNKPVTAFSGTVTVTSVVESGRYSGSGN